MAYNAEAQRRYARRKAELRRASKSDSEKINAIVNYRGLTVIVETTVDLDRLAEHVSQSVN